MEAYKTKGGWWAQPVYLNPITGDVLVVHHESNSRVTAVWTRADGRAIRPIVTHPNITADYDRATACPCCGRV